MFYNQPLKYSSLLEKARFRFIIISKMYEDYLFNSSPKGYSEDQDKNVLPEETYNKALLALKNAFPETQFALTEIVNTEFYSVYDFDDGLLNTHGKGATKHQSMASAIMEYIERKSWLEYNFGNAKGFIKASYDELSEKIDMSAYKNIFTIHYYAEKEKNQKLLKSIPLFWVEAYDLVNKKPILFPVNFVDLTRSSNGLAAGNTKEEAITQGLCELIEREHIDNFLIDPYNSKIKLIDTQHITNPYLINLLDWAKDNNITVYFFDISTQLPVTTILVHCIDNNPPTAYTRTGNGYGTHLDPEKAMIRAFTEFLQGREGYKKDLPKSMNIKKGNWQSHLNLDFTRIINNSKTISIQKCPNLSHTDFLHDLEKLISILKQKKHGIIALNLTHPNLGIPVYRLFVPQFKTGDEFSAFARNQHYTVSFLIKNARLDDMAWDYYNKYKQTILEPNDEIKELISEISKINQSMSINSLIEESTKNDIVFHLMMPRNHINIFKFAAYYKKDIEFALKCLGAIIKNPNELNDETELLEQDLNSVQTQPELF